MKPEFHEDFVSAHTDPTAEPYCDFDWDELYACLGEATNNDEQIKQRLAEAVRQVFQWMLSNNINKKNAAEFIGRRAVAFAWVMNPELFEGKSMTAVAASLGLPKQILSKASSEASREFGIQNRGQAHAWNRGLKASEYAHRGSTAVHGESDQPAPPESGPAPDNANPSCVKESFVDVPRVQVRQQGQEHLPSAKN